MTYKASVRLLLGLALNAQVYAYLAHPAGPMLALPSTSRPDDATPDKNVPLIEPHGYAQLHTGHDSRQTAGLWAAGFVLAPMPYDPTTSGCDKNATGQFTMAQTLSVLGCDSGPFTMGGARISGKCYGQFQGFLAQTAGGSSFEDQRRYGLAGAFTISSVYAHISWPHASLKIGHDYHPLYPTQAEPRVVSGNSGIPFVPAIPNPQIEFTFTAKNTIFLSATAYTQLLYADVSPHGSFVGNPDMMAISHSGLPALAIILGYKSPQGHVLWVAADARRLLPDLRIGSYVNANGVTCARGSIFGCLHTEKFDLMGQVIGGGNASDLVNLGGYAVESVSKGAGSIIVGECYRNLRFITMWSNLDFKTKKLFSSGVFAGYTRNLGSSKKLYISPSTGQPLVFEYPIAPGWHVKDITRASIYGRCNWGPMEVGLEFEWTRARYAVRLDEYALPAKTPHNCQAVTDLHIDLATTFTF